MIVWVGHGSPTDPSVVHASLGGEGEEGIEEGAPHVIPSERKLAQDWAVAMPPKGVSDLSST